MTSLTLMEGAEPFLYPGNGIGCLLVHGHGGAPHNLRWLGQYLNEQGYTVFAPRLAGHGMSRKDLNHVQWREWVADVLAAYGLLRARCQKVFGLGVSLGGALCLLLAAHEKVDGVVAMATPHRYPFDWRWPVLYALSLVGGVMPEPDIPPEQDVFLQRIQAEQRSRGEKPIGRVTYGKDSARSLLQVFALLDEMRAGLPSISAPLLFIHSLADHVVPFEHMQRNYDDAGSRDEQMMVLQSDRHGIAEHPDLMTEIFRAAGEFIARH